MYNGIDDVRRCIESIQHSNNQTSCELICVNDCSTDDSVLDYLRQKEAECTDIKIINSDINRGFVMTVNKGIRSRRFKNVVILNSDTIVPESFVDRLCFAHSLDPSYGVLTPLSLSLIHI